MEEIIKALYMGMAACIFVLALSALIFTYKEYMDMASKEVAIRKEAVIHNGG